MNDLIVIFVDPDSRETLIDFPIPEGGKPKLEAPRTGETFSRWGPMNCQQKAYRIFWDNGMQERIDELTKNGKGAGLRQTLRWLVNMQIDVVKQKTAWQYRLLVLSSRSKWDQYKKDHVAT